MRPVNALLVLAALAALVSGELRAGPLEQQSEVPVFGEYRNLDYAYSVQIPTGLRAYRMKAPAPNHGIDMHAPGNEAEFILIDASFDAAGYGSAGTSARARADYYMGEYGLKQLKVSRRVLSGLNAQDMILRGQSRGGRGETNYVHLIVAFRPMGDDNTPIIYTIAVLASTTDSAVVKALPEVVGSFRAIPLPKRSR